MLFTEILKDNGYHLPTLAACEYKGPKNLVGVIVPLTPVLGSNPTSFLIEINDLMSDALSPKGALGLIIIAPFPLELTVRLTN